MRVTVIGTGYVGLVVGACTAETGNQVMCADLDEAKIDGLKRNVLPIYEPGLEDLVERNQRAGRLIFTTDVAAAIAAADTIFVAVGTPQEADGSADIRAVLAVAEQIGRHMSRELVVAMKSTVPVGTADKVEAAIARHAKYPFHVVSNPEFLKEGAAVDDFMKPDRVVLGASSDYARTAMAEIYAPYMRIGKPMLFMDVRSAEMTKYAANAMLATRISFMNEMANLCERVGANIDFVRRGLGTDPRIGPYFLFPGAGYGGSCFPKDVKALVRISEDRDAPLSVLRAVDEANDRQKHRPFEKLRDALGPALSGSRVALWGLAFKPQTDDMREASSLTFIEDALAAGVQVIAHDPIAMEEARRRIGDRIEYAETNYDALRGADALVLLTEWLEYRHPDFARMRELLKRPLIIDGRNVYDPAKMGAFGFVHMSIGRATAGALRD